jgi:hypothetical protein
MTATPAQVANDLAAQAEYFRRRDDETSRACRDCARAIRALEAGEPLQDHVYGQLRGRVLNAWYSYRAQPDTQIENSLHRGLATLTTLRQGTIA